MLPFGLALAHAPQVGALDSLLLKQPMTCRDWAVAANEFIALGERRAVARLKRTEADVRDRYSTIPLREGLLCRILFLPKRGGALRLPLFGGLDLPYRSMPAARWPEYPLASQDGVWFLLSDEYMLAGHPEATADYVDYCLKAGSFRQAPLRVPTSEQAVRALDSLLATPRWRAIRWSLRAASESYEISPELVIDRLRKQTRF